MGLMQHSVQAALRKSNVAEDMKIQWSHIADRLERLETQLRAGHSSLAFSFIEGALVSTFNLCQLH
jgi:midasin (ATPase involved in ribosome maturation)